MTDCNGRAKPTTLRSDALSVVYRLEKLFQKFPGFRLAVARHL